MRDCDKTFKSAFAVTPLRLVPQSHALRLSMVPYYYISYTGLVLRRNKHCNRLELKPTLKFFVESRSLILSITYIIVQSSHADIA